jgi:predicted enzyme related to lactoylglutathione lyase
MPRIVFVELPTSNLTASRQFFSDAFGLAFTDFGPTYSCMMTGDVDLGLQADASDATTAPLAVIAVDDLEKALEAVQKRAAASPGRCSPSPAGGVSIFATRAEMNSRRSRRSESRAIIHPFSPLTTNAADS